VFEDRVPLDRPVEPAEPLSMLDAIP